MTTKNDLSSIVLVYKGKLLMLLHDTNPEVYDNPQNTNASHWGFLTVKRENGQSLESSILTKVESVTGIKLKEIVQLAMVQGEEKSEYFFQAKLTDENVNNMLRANNRVLQFFSLKEVLKLNLETISKKFVEENIDTISV